MSKSSSKIQFLRAISGAHSYHPNYHAVSDADMPHVKQLFTIRTSQQFKADLDFFLSNYTPVSLGDVNAALSGGRALPRNPMMLTVDDGFREAHDIMAPILLAKGCPAAFYLCSDFIDNKTLNWRSKISLLIEALAETTAVQKLKLASFLDLQRSPPSSQELATAIRSIKYRQRHLLDACATALDMSFEEYLQSRRPYMTSSNVASLLKQGFDIGSHSIDHPLFNELTEQECLNQATTCMNLLEESFGVRLRSFAHPFSNVGLSQRHIRQLLEEGGFKIILGTSGGKVDIDKRVIHRNAIEDSKQRSAEHIVADYLARFVPRRLAGRQKLDRPVA
jgi:peptidoglycan/xylan/chitin deacetylase (PgdA/CDA1 family)